MAYNADAEQPTFGIEKALSEAPKSVDSSFSPARHDVITTMNYYKEREGVSTPELDMGKPEKQEAFRDTRQLVVTDISGQESSYTLESHGFQLCQHVSLEKDFLDEDKIKTAYYPEMEKLLKDVTGAIRVLIFDHTIRRESTNEANPRVRGPVRRVHLDQSKVGVENRINMLLADDAQELLRKRHQIINAWRPIKTAYKDPFGIIDSKSVHDDDLVTMTIHYPGRVVEICSVKARQEHRWYFKYAQRPDEVLLFKGFDSLADGRATRCPHSAFVDEAEVDKPTRESIEIRALLFYGD